MAVLKHNTIVPGLFISEKFPLFDFRNIVATASLGHWNVSWYLEEYLCLASFPVLLFREHRFTDALRAFLFTFLSREKKKKQSSSNYSARKVKRKDARYNHPYRSLLFGDRRGEL